MKSFSVILALLAASATALPTGNEAAVDVYAREPADAPVYDGPALAVRDDDLTDLSKRHHQGKTKNKGNGNGNANGNAATTGNATTAATTTTTGGRRKGNKNNNNNKREVDLTGEETLVARHHQGKKKTGNGNGNGNGNGATTGNATTAATATTGGRKHKNNNRSVMADLSDEVSSVFARHHQGKTKNKGGATTAATATNGTTTTTGGGRKHKNKNNQRDVETQLFDEAELVARHHQGKKKTKGNN